MRRLIMFSLLAISVFVVCGAVRCDSLRVSFALNKATFNPTLDNNAALMEKFIDGIVTAEKSGCLDSVVVYGYASPDGPFLNNDRLSIQRCNSVAEYISRHAGISMKYIRTSPGGVAWEGLRALVTENTNTPSRDTVIRILDRYIPGACTNRVMSDRCMKSLIDIDNGHTYRWMVDNLFTELRFALAVYTYTHADPQPAPIDDSSCPEKTDETEPDSVAVNPIPENIEPAPDPAISSADAEDRVDSIRSTETEVSPMAYEPFHRLAVKTNLLYDVALLPNLEVEWLINKHWSVALEGGVSCWRHVLKDKDYYLAMISPEVKRWIRPRAPWHGFYVGAFAVGGLYDFCELTHGYRGEGVAAGLSVGYMWPLSRCLSLEAAIGGGYLYSRYKEYEVLDGHHVYQRTKDLNYFGPLKVKLSLVWRLWDINKPGRSNNLKTVLQHEK